MAKLVDYGQRNISQVSEEKAMFRVFLLKDDQDQNTEVREVEEINFEEVGRHLKRGISVLLTSTRRPPRSSNATEASTEPWYFTHI